MRKFIKNILFFVLFIAIASVVLDKLYTEIHYKGTPRNKPDFIMGMTESDSLNFAIFGSSRALHTIDMELIEKKTNKKGFNFAVTGSSVFEIKLSVQQIIKRKVTKNIYIQIDYIWNEFYSGGGCTVDWFPYIIEEDIWEEFKKIDINNEYLYYKKIPFFRYIKYDSKIGFRELIMSLSGREMAQIKKKGYIPLFNVAKNLEGTVKYNLKEDYNIHVRDIIEICKNERVNVFFFTSPIYNFEGSNRVLKQYLPNYTDFSKSVSNPILYQDNTHLNAEGAKLFTTLFINNYMIEN